MNIAVIGHTGMVGGAIARYLQKKGHEVMGWSRSNQTHTWEVINETADWIIVAVPTPYSWTEKTVKLDALRETLGKIAQGKNVVHKCTVPPGTTEMLQAEFPEIKLCYNPEFLSEATADQDFQNPDRQIIGYTKQSYSVATEALHLFPNSPYDVIIKATEAELCKFINNFHGALMVIFSNFFYDAAKVFPGLDFEAIKKSAQASKWVGSPMGRMYWDVFHGGFRGYGGKCFPKDVGMLLDWCAVHNVPSEILEATKAANGRLLAAQDMTEEDV